MYTTTVNAQPDNVEPSEKPPPPVTKKQTVIMGVIAGIVGLVLVLGAIVGSTFVSNNSATPKATTTTSTPTQYGKFANPEAMVKAIKARIPAATQNGTSADAGVPGARYVNVNLGVVVGLYTFDSEASGDKVEAQKHNYLETYRGKGWLIVTESSVHLIQVLQILEEATTAPTSTPSTPLDLPTPGEDGCEPYDC